MGKVKKAATERHQVSISPYISDFIDKTTITPLHKLPELLATFPQSWPFPRGDLYHWIPTLDRFDGVLELFVKEYGLDQGPQTQAFEQRVLIKGDLQSEGKDQKDQYEIGSHGFSSEGDRELVEAILRFSRILLEHCGNRSLYASGPHLNNLLHSTSLTLIKATLKLTLCLALRYYSSRLRATSPHFLNSLLAQHYSITLDRLQKMATTFPKKASQPQVANGTPFKSKEKGQDAPSTAYNPADFCTVVKSKEIPEYIQDAMMDVQMTYYDESSNPNAVSMTISDDQDPASPLSPATPSPVRSRRNVRSAPELSRSNLGPNSSNHNESSTSGEELSETPSRSAKHIPSESSGNKTIRFAEGFLVTPSWAIVKELLPQLPADSQYELLQRVRVAKAFSESKSAVDDIVAIRLLAIANLTYVYGDTTFQQKIGQADSEEPRQYQLAQQLTDLLQPSSENSEEVPRELSIIALCTLEGLSKVKCKSSEVTTALNIGVSHGILFYILHNIVSSVEANKEDPEEDEWREAVFTLVMALSNSNNHQRTGDLMVAAGLIPILVKVLQIRNAQAEKLSANVLQFLDTFVHNGVRDAFQSLVAAKGLDVIADLTAATAQSSLEAAEQTSGLPLQYKTKITDYQITFNQQQTLRLLFKFMAHMFHHNTGAQDRLLRNLIDSPQLLGALKIVIGNASVFGSNIWSGAVNIVSSFIHSEPTSYNVIAEAGLSKGLLEAITQSPIAAEESDTSAASESPRHRTETLNTAAALGTNPSGILPVGETMRDIPTAFGAICLNEAGLNMFKASNALQKYLEIFTSPEHIKALESDSEVPMQIGVAFDELVRHHPPLKTLISDAVSQMVSNVTRQCKLRARDKGVGAKLWVEGSDGKIVVAGGRRNLHGLSSHHVERLQAQATFDFDSALSYLDPAPVSEQEMESDALINGETSGNSTSDSISVVCKFLQGFFHNSTMSTRFCETGGAELLLDLITCPCNPYNFLELSTYDEVSRVVKQLVEHKPHLVLPSLLRRTQLALYQLRPMVDHTRGDAFFVNFTTTSAGSGKEAAADSVTPSQVNGTYIAKALAATHALSNILADVFSMQTYHAHRSTHHSFFTQINMTDVYIDLVNSMGKLYSACVWEEIYLQNAMPEDWMDRTRVRGLGYDNAEANNVMGQVSAGPNPFNGGEDARTSDSTNGSDTNDNRPTSSGLTKSHSAAFKNTQMLRYLLGQIPRGVGAFFQALGKSLLAKTRTMDVYQKQNAFAVAANLAQAAITQMKSPTPVTAKQPKDRLAYDIVVLSSTMQILVEKRSSRNMAPEVLTLVLQKFMLQGGFALLSSRLESYCDQIQEHSSKSDGQESSDDGVQSLLLSAASLILEFYAKITHFKNIHESSQSNAMATGNTDPKHANYYQPAQFVVEIRNAVLPALSRIWDSDVADLLETGSLKSVISVLRFILEADGEHNALKRSADEKRRIPAEKKKWRLRIANSMETMTSDGRITRAMAMESLFRCNENLNLAREYCTLRGTGSNIPNFPPPKDELDQPLTPQTDAEIFAGIEAQSSTPTGTSALARVPSVEMQDADEPSDATEAAEADDVMSDADDAPATGRRDLPADMMPAPEELPDWIARQVGGNTDLVGHILPSHSVRRTSGVPEVETQERFVTVDDLNDKRIVLREDLIDRCLNVLNTHSDITFELADLITAAVPKSADSAAVRSNIGETLVNALMSLRPDEDSPPEGKKIASYAHLLALVIQDREFFDASLEHLKEYFEALIGFVRITPDIKFEDAASWISNVLLIVERVLAEDEQPQQIQWTPPPIDQPLQEQKPVALKEPIVPFEEKESIFGAILEILPKIGKDESLALSVVRTLVVLTRYRSIAKQLGEKQKIGRLFVMVKQLSGITNERLQSAFLIVLRHIIEDEDTIRQIMRTEIVAAFETSRSNRPMDTTAYTRNFYHLVLRNPEIFVEVTNEKVQLTRWNGAQTPQALTLKKDETPEETPKAEDAAATKTVEQTPDAVPRPGLERTKTLDSKPPVIENPDGVIQFLLKELSSYRDVEDKEPAAAALAGPAEASASTTDVDMADSTPIPGQETPSAASSTELTKPGKPEFKAEQHSIYIYRCFILQCLTELMASYNRTKIEFINFTPKVDYQVATPTKPRSGLLNYLLTQLIPVGTLEHKDDIAFRKRHTTSNWAISVIVALCAKTSERVPVNDEEEPELVYVRKFVLEHALKVFKDAVSSSEPLDQRYSRLLSLSDLFNRMLTSKPSSGNTSSNLDMMIASQKQLGKLMYEKHFITTLTASIAEVDLNFPNSKRAVKYVLRPLKWLTDIAVDLSATSDSNPLGTTDEDEISSATSVSENEDEREETPDLFRNSTLGQFEANREEESESGSEVEEDEDDYYAEEYDEEMDYEDEGQERDHGDVISDEDDEGMGEIEGMPGDVNMNLEIVMEDGDSEEDDDDDDDDDDDTDDDDDIEILDEVTGDDENDSGEEGEDEEDWEDEAGDGYGEEDEIDGDPLLAASQRGGPLEHMARVLDGDDRSETLDQLEGGDVGLEMDMGAGEYFEDEMGGEEEDEDEEDYDGEEVVYEPEYDDGDDDDEDGMGWGWDDQPTGLLRHHHHNARIPPDPWNSDARVQDERLGQAVYRSHGNARGAPRGNDDGTNPLLQRGEPHAAAAPGNRSRTSPWSELLFAEYPGRLGAVRPDGRPREVPGFVSDLIQMVGPQGARINIVDAGNAGFPGGFSPFVVTAGPGGLQFPRNPPNFFRAGSGGITQMFRALPHQRSDGSSHRVSSNDPAQAVSFVPTLSVTRWQDEARILFGAGYVERSVKVINSILRLLTPPAMENKRQRDKAEAERKAAEEKAKEEQRKKEEAERIEREAQEKKEREEREAREAEEAAARAQEQAEGAEARGTASVEMEGVEESTAPSNAAAEPEAAVQRITTTIRGREIDITSLGIDADYLMALPEELREDVVMTQFAGQRSQAVEAGEQPSEISREFLEALPPEIQRELVRQENLDRQQRERNEARRRAAASGAAPVIAQPEEMNTADFMAMLDPALRQSVLMEADDNVLAALPAEFQAEARALLGDRRSHQLDRMVARRMAMVDDRQPDAARAEPEQNRPRRPVGQILEKSGVATLLRLMFVAMQGSARTTMHGIFSDICKNTQNRAEVISILLSILQDGSADGNALERSFAQLTLRAKHQSGPKTPQPLKRTLTEQLPTPSADMSPLMIVQQCLSTLTTLAHDNPRVSSFFLSEHETITSQRAKSVRKGKGKETKASRFPLNALLTLLDRKTIIENSTVMEHLAALLVKVSEPLKILLRRTKEAEEVKDEKDKLGALEASIPAPPPRLATAAADVTMGESAPETAAAETAETFAEGADNKEPAKPATEEKKKHRDLTPPEVPEENLCLVVNIIAARECSGKTFQNTLEIINHLSAIPGARDIFGKELVRRAQELGGEVLHDLELLGPQIRNAKTSTDVQGMALTNFSPASTHQNKLLRVLLALDYIFDPKRAQDRPAVQNADSLPQKAKDDLVSSLYDSETFVKLWNTLSDCLTAIRQRGNMNNVATILQPLVESFMVVCKNTTVKEVTFSQEHMVSTPPSADNSIESLFFSFTEEHRKILNDLVRHNPKLMNGTFDVLVKNSKVLEFDNKRNYFNKRLHLRTAEERMPHQSLQLNIRRDQIFLDSFKSLYYKKPNEIKYGKLNIRFHGEEGVDAGGVTREWFASLSRQMFDPNYALFNPVASDRTTFHPNPLSEVNEQHLTFFKFIGRIIGKALYEGRVLDCHFSRAVYKRILGKPVSLKDMETLDLDYYKSLCWILENDITDVTFETFSVDVDRFGETQVIDLIPNGREIPVTEENKHEYVRLVVEQRLTKSVDTQLEHFLIGFREIVPESLISIFNEQELELLISGLPDIDVEDWKANTEYHNYTATSPQTQWFWRAVRSFDKEEKAKLLQFVTGTSKVPLNGFKELEGMNGFSKFNIHRDFGSKDRLPSSHTCFNQLDLPEYDSYEALRQQVYTAITAGSEYFGFA